MSAMNKQYKRLSEIDEEEQAILVKILKEINDINLVSTEFNVSSDDLEKLLQEENKKEQQIIAEAQKRAQQLAEAEKAQQLVKKDKNSVKQPQRLVADQEKNKNLQTQSTPTAQSRSKSKNKKTDYRMRSIRNKYYYFYKRKSNIVPKAIQRKLTSKEEQEVDELISLVNKGIINSKMMRSLEGKIEIIDDMDKLSELYRALQTRKGSYDFRVEGMKSRLSSKITKLRAQASIDKIVNSASKDIEEIVEGVVFGNIDVEEAKRKIENETQRRLSVAPKNSGKFAMTEEQCRKQVYIQIRRILTDRAGEFLIVDPVKSLIKLNEITGKDDAYMNVSAVVKNLSSRREYGLAQSVCENFSKEIPAVSSLEREILGKEIGEIVLEQIRKNATPEEDTIFMNVLEKRLGMSGINKKLISLGASEDGTRNITLEDVWYENRIK